MRSCLENSRVALRSSLPALLLLGGLLQACDQLGTAPTDAEEASTDSGVADTSAACRDRDGDNFGTGCTAGPDCNDADPNVSPDATEECGDSIDNDCDGGVDNALACLPCSPDCVAGQSRCEGDRVVQCSVDARNCGNWGAAAACAAGESCDIETGACNASCPDADADGFSPRCGAQRDCDDTQASNRPGAAEICDGQDNDCNLFVDENQVCGGCVDDCPLDAAECIGSSIRQCLPDATGCLRWSAATACPSGQSCSGGVCRSAPTCVDPDGDGAGLECSILGDCRPFDSSSSPAVATDRCDGADNDCDGAAEASCNGCGIVTNATPGSFTFRACAAGTVLSLPTGAATVVALSGESPTVTLTIGTLSGTAFTPSTGGTADGTSFTFDHGAAFQKVSSKNAVKVTAAANASVTVAITDHVTAACADDIFEPNNGPGAPAFVGTPPFSAANRICGGNDYWQASSLGRQIVWAVNGTATGADAVLEAWPGATPARTTGFVMATASGKPWLRQAWVRQPASGGSALFGLRTTASSGTADRTALAIVGLPIPACTDDETGAGDGTPATATALRRGVPNAGTLCAGDVDLWQVGALAAGSQLSASATVSTADLAVYLLREGWDGVTISGSVGATTQPLDIRISSAGTYYVAVVGRTPLAQGSYTVTY